VHIQDLWPQTVLSSGFVEGRTTGGLKRTLNLFCDTVYRHAHTVAVTSPGMTELIERRGVDPSKIEFVPNWADESAFRPVPRDAAMASRLGITAPFTVMYAGNFGEYQALDVVVEAAALLRDQPHVGFALVGGGVDEERLRRMVVELGMTNVVFVGQQPFDKMASILALGHVQLVSLQDVPLFRTTLPSKLQATLAAARPVLGALTGDAADLVRASNAGVVVTPGNPSEMASAILRMSRMPAAELDALGARGRHHSLAHYSEQIAGDRLSALLDRAARGMGARV
ncbi:MAG: glycosyltransferase family 4 protein, partial [Lacisediminihabitans sp.]